MHRTSLWPLGAYSFSSAVVACNPISSEECLYPFTCTGNDMLPVGVSPDEHRTVEWLPYDEVCKLRGSLTRVTFFQHPDLPQTVKPRCEFFEDLAWSPIKVFGRESRELSGLSDQESSKRDHLRIDDAER